MESCKICGFEVANNFGGQLTNHLKKIHNLSLEDYVVKFFLSGLAPKCACGLCDDRPVFSRGKFLTYALNHQRYDKKEKLYKEKFGTPTCLECGKEVDFLRGNPKKFCSQKCVGKNAGFSLEKTQAKIKDELFKKHGVNNVSKLDGVRAKLSQALKGKPGKQHTESSKKMISESIKEKWKDETYREKMENIEFSPQERKRRSEWLKKKNTDEKFRENLFLKSKNRLTKLHQKIKKALDLENLGFISEQRVLRYFADELNEKKKIVLEIYGDYPHANPKNYSQDSLIKLYGQTYTAFEKWESDEARRKNIEKAGYKVFIIWESDDLEIKREELKNLCEIFD